MTSFHCSVLSRFAFVDEVMNNAVFSTEPVQSVNCFDGDVASFVCTDIIVREGGMIVGLYGRYFVFKPVQDIFQKFNRMKRRLLVEYPEMPPSGSRVYGRVLEISVNYETQKFMVYLSKNI